MDSVSQSPTDFTTAHGAVIALCDLFDKERSHFTGVEYNEAEARVQFITPFFKALGWDVDNAAHRSVYEKDVVVEKRQDVAGHARRADYAFRRPGSHLSAFFVEAKKPSSDIRNHQDCYQAVQYGWNAKLPLVVLTNFAQLYILDARAEPESNNSVRFILPKGGSYRIADYRDAEKFAEIWGLLSRAHVAAGSLDKAAAALPRLSGRLHRDDLFARGTGPVDETFLAEMEVWRAHLAKQLKKDNHDLDGERLTALTQRILDRLVFLRFLEDRGIEHEFTFAKIGKSGSAWSDFLTISKRLDARYNGIIYKKDPAGCEDESLHIDDASFSWVAGRFAPENSKYLFNSISVTILGSIYERFLGNVIVARNKTAVVEPKPEVRKAGGVYYTPDYIVRYIVEQTVGRSIDGKKPEDITALRFADIACGSGSFLVEVFASLIRYHLKWYLADGGPKWEKKKVLRKRELDDEYVLTLAEKRRILLNNVYGVDLDLQAVEVTQLSLYLRLMEDESFPSTQLLFDEERRALLPDLRENVICGNSLIETDIADLFGLSIAEQEKIRPFDFRWAFPKVFKQARAVASKSAIAESGFDAIVGNPPYVQLSMKEFRNEDVNRYLRNHYGFSGGRMNTFAFFLDRARQLLQSDGRLGYIVPNTILSQEYYESLRRILLENTVLEQLVSPIGQIFEAAVVETVIVTLRNSVTTSANASTVRFSRLHANSTEDLQVEAPQKAFYENYRLSFLVPSGYGLNDLKLKLQKCTTSLGEYLNINQAIALKHDRAACLETSKLTNKHHEILDGRHIERYRTGTSPNYFKFDLEKIHSCKREDIFLAPEKILFRRVGERLTGSYDTARKFALNTLVVITPKPECPFALKFVLGLFNSTLFSFAYVTYLKSTKKTFSEIQARQIGEMRFPATDLGDADVKINHDKIVKLVERMLVAKQAEFKPGGGIGHEHWTRQTAALDRQIDALVYELYGLSDDEIALVEAGV